MASLWTPEGEHRVERETGEQQQSAGSSGEPDDVSVLVPDAPTTEELAALERELLSTPVDAIIANHCYGIFQLAALHLGQRPPNLEEARLCIDALSAVVETLDERLGDSAATLHEALAQIRLAFVQIASVQPGTNGNGPSSPSADSGESSENS